MDAPYVIVSGPLGVGKTTLTQKLAKDREWMALLESAAEGNPFLERFYADLPRWAFHSQSYYLSEALQQIVQARQSNVGVVQDRSIWEHVGIFATMLHRSGNLDRDELKLLDQMQQTVTMILPQPQVLIYLHGDPALLHERIHSRGRAYEQELPEGYLEQLCGRYREWIADWALCPVLPIDIGEENLQEAAVWKSVNQDLDKLLSGKPAVRQL